MKATSSGRAGGNAALLIIDVINDLEFDGGERLLPFATRMAGVLTRLKKRAAAAGVPVLYVNDNFGHWRSNFMDVYRQCSRRSVRGSAITRKLAPKRGDYFVLKPKHSGFFSTSLVPLLDFLGIDTLILTGVATNICVFFTAHDAHMREYKIIVAADACAAETEFDHNAALDQLRRYVHTTVVKADDLNLKALKPDTSVAKRSSLQSSRRKKSAERLA